MQSYPLYRSILAVLMANAEPSYPLYRSILAVLMANAEPSYPLYRSILAVLMANAEPSCLQTVELLKTFCKTVAPQLNKSFFFKPELDICVIVYARKFGATCLVLGQSAIETLYISIHFHSLLGNEPDP